MPSLRTIVLVAESLTPAAWEPFGALPDDEGSEHDVAEAEFLWDDGCVNYISHTADEVEESVVGLRCTLVNRHDTHTQTLMPVDNDAVIVVAPASVSFDVETDLDDGTRLSCAGRQVRASVARYLALGAVSRHGRVRTSPERPRARLPARQPRRPVRRAVRRGLRHRHRRERRRYRIRQPPVVGTCSPSPVLPDVRRSSRTSGA